MSHLDVAVRQYARAIRWERFEVARSMMRARGETPVTAEPEMPAMDVTADESRIVSVTPDGNEAVVSYTFEYILDSQNKTRYTTQRVVMYWEEKENRWFVDGRLPKF